MEIEVLDVSKFIQKHKLVFRPEILMQFICKYNEISTMMVQKIAKKFTIDANDCKYCQKLRETKGNSNAFCKKHRAIAEWGKIEQKRSGISKIADLRFCIFSQYVIIEMKNDPEGVFVLWFGHDPKSNSFNVYCLNKKYFENAFDVGYDITELLDKNKILIGNNWQLFYNETNHMPIIDLIK